MARMTRKKADVRSRSVRLTSIWVAICVLIHANLPCTPLSKVTMAPQWPIFTLLAGLLQVFCSNASGYEEFRCLE